MASGYDISASASDSTTQAGQTGSFNFSTNSGTKWLPLALVALVGVYLVLYFMKRK